MRRWTGILLGLLLLPSLVAARVELRLADGEVLVGRSVERVSAIYVLDVGSDVPPELIPVALVRELRLIVGVPEPEAEEDTPAEGPDPRPSAEPRAGATVPDLEENLRAPGRTESVAKQLAAFGRDPAGFRPSVVPTRWEFDDVLGYETDVTQFHPVTWRTPIYDAHWRPQSAYGDDLSPIPDFAPVTWRNPPLRQVWYPRDGFGQTVWFPPVTTPRD